MNTHQKETPPTGWYPARAASKNNAHSIAPLEVLLPLLARVRETGPGRWMASCPTDAHRHGDRSRGLSVRETDGGTLLIHCFGGCSVEAVVSAVGLSLADLFPRRMESPALTGRRIAVPRLRAEDVIEVAAIEADIAARVCGDVLAGRDVSPEDLARANQAVGTLAGIAREVRHG